MTDEERRKFKEHLKKCSEEVSKWPKWQQNLLGDLGDLSSDRASFRNPVKQDSAMNPIPEPLTAANMVEEHGTSQKKTT